MCLVDVPYMYAYKHIIWKCLIYLSHSCLHIWYTKLSYCFSHIHAYVLEIYNEFYPFSETFVTLILEIKNNEQWTSSFQIIKIITGCFDLRKIVFDDFNNFDNIGFVSDETKMQVFNHLSWNKYLQFFFSFFFTSYVGTFILKSKLRIYHNLRLYRISAWQVWVALVSFVKLLMEPETFCHGYK